MSQTSHIEAIRADLACPQCQYNLRGLRGEVVTCPECGLSCNVAQLITRRWDKPWYDAPGFNRVLLPGCWLYIVLLFGNVTLLFMPPAGALLLVVFTAFGGFAGLIAAARRWWGGNEAIWLAMLPVFLITGYLATVAGVITGLIMVFGFSGPLEMLAGLLVLPLSVGLGVLCRFGERFIAGRCIKHYLAQGIALA